MSRRVGLRFVSVEGFLKRVKYRLVGLITYVLRRRFIARVFYYPKPYGKGRYAEVTRVSITLQECVPHTSTHLSYFFLALL